MDNRITYEWYQKSYSQEGLSAQRRWPNEELCRFMGRNFFNISFNERKDIKILEAGCGSGANLKMIVQEGFDTYGLDLSDEAINMVKDIFGSRENFHVLAGDMLSLPNGNNMFDAVVDVFSANCLTEKQFGLFCEELYRVLKVGGKFFSYTPSKGSDAWMKKKKEDMLDFSTVNGMNNKEQPYYGNFYPWRFMDIDDIGRFFDKEKFVINYTEKVIRTYNKTKTKFEFLVFEVQKI